MTTSELLVNPLRSSVVPPVGSSDPSSFHRRLPGYVPTPLVAAPGLASSMGLASLHVKVESSRVGLPAFKILGASWAVYRLLCSRLGGEPSWSTLDELVAAVAPLGR